MNFLRSIFFNVYFFIITTLFCSLGLAFIWMPTSFILKIAYTWSWMTQLGLRLFLNIKININDEAGLYNMRDGSYIVASKHQSALETIIFYTIFRNPIFVLKKELTYIPIFGILAWKIHISVDRGNRKAMSGILKQLPRAIKRKRKIIIFPEGTRNKVGMKKDKIKYKSGVYYIAKNNPDLKILPVNINTGEVWGKKAFVKKSGAVNINIYKPFKASDMKNKKLFLEELKNAVEK